MQGKMDSGKFLAVDKAEEFRMIKTSNSSAHRVSMFLSKKLQKCCKDAHKLVVSRMVCQVG